MRFRACDETWENNEDVIEALALNYDDLLGKDIEWNQDTLILGTTKLKERLPHLKNLGVPDYTSFEFNTVLSRDFEKDQEEGYKRFYRKYLEQIKTAICDERAFEALEKARREDDINEADEYVFGLK